MCLLLRSGFHLATTIKGLVECCRDGCPSGRFFHLHKGTLELCQSDRVWVLSHLPDQGPCPPIAQSGRTASSRKSLDGSKLLPFKNDGGHCVLEDLNAIDMFGTLPQICAPTQACCGELLTSPSTSWLCFYSDMHRPLWDLIKVDLLPQVASKL